MKIYKSKEARTKKNILERPYAYCSSYLKVMKASLKINEANNAAHPVSSLSYLGILIWGHMEISNVANYQCDDVCRQDKYPINLDSSMKLLKRSCMLHSCQTFCQIVILSKYRINSGRVPVSWLQ